MRISRRHCLGHGVGNFVGGDIDVSGCGCRIGMTGCGLGDRSRATLGDLSDVAGAYVMKAVGLLDLGSLRRRLL